MKKYIYDSSRFRKNCRIYEKLTKTTRGWVWKKIREREYIVCLAYELKRLDECKIEKIRQYDFSVEYLIKKDIINKK